MERYYQIWDFLACPYFQTLSWELRFLSIVTQIFFSVLYKNLEIHSLIFKCLPFVLKKKKIVGMHQVQLSCFKAENATEQFWSPKCRALNKMKQLSLMPEQIQEDINKFVDTFPNPQIRKICFVVSNYCNSICWGHLRIAH